MIIYFCAGLNIDKVDSSYSVNIYCFCFAKISSFLQHAACVRVQLMLFTIWLGGNPSSKYLLTYFRATFFIQKFSAENFHFC